MDAQQNLQNFKERQYAKGNSRDDDMIGDTLGRLQGEIIKGTLTRANAGGAYYGNLTAPFLPPVDDAQNEWYVKRDVGGMPGYASQKGPGTPRVLLLVRNGQPTDIAYFSPHYTSFERLGPAFFKRAETMKAILSK